MRPMRICTDPRVRSRSSVLSVTSRTTLAPIASPRMNADSINSNECVALPRTSESMRIHPISYAKEAVAVPRLTARRAVAAKPTPDSASPGAGGPARLEPSNSLPDATGSGNEADTGRARTVDQTRAAATRLRTAAAREVPGRPNAPIIQNPAIKTPADPPSVLSR